MTGARKTFTGREKVERGEAPWKVQRYGAAGRNYARIVEHTPPLSRILIEPKTWFLDEDLGCDEHVEFEAMMNLIVKAVNERHGLIEALEQARRVIKEIHNYVVDEERMKDDENNDAEWFAENSTDALKTIDAALQRAKED